MLDHPEIYRRLDPYGMGEHLRGMPEQCRGAWEAAQGFHLPEEFSHVEKVVVAGMGGSGIGGDLLRSLAAPESPVPLFVQKDYQLPAFVDHRTLFIASSYSGNTEEVLCSLEEALARKARVLAMTSGGELAARAQKKGFPVFSITYRAPPRATVMFSFIPMLVFFQHMGFIGPKDEDFSEAVEQMEHLMIQVVEGVPIKDNPAKKLAIKLRGRLPVIYGAEHLSEVARRWKTQFNENSKSWAFHEVLPELHHNAVNGYSFPAELKEKLLIVLLHSPALHPRTALRYVITKEILEKAGIAHEVVEAMGSSLLSQLVTTILLGDWVSLYLAMLNSVDPLPVPVIDYVKERLGKP